MLSRHPALTLPPCSTHLGQGQGVVSAPSYSQGFTGLEMHPLVTKPEDQPGAAADSFLAAWGAEFCSQTRQMEMFYPQSQGVDPPYGSDVLSPLYLKDEDLSPATHRPQAPAFHLCTPAFSVATSHEHPAKKIQPYLSTLLPAMCIANPAHGGGPGSLGARVLSL